MIERRGAATSQKLRVSFSPLSLPSFLSASFPTPLITFLSPFISLLPVLFHYRGPTLWNQQEGLGALWPPPVATEPVRQTFRCILGWKIGLWWVATVVLKKFTSKNLIYKSQSRPNLGCQTPQPAEFIGWLDAHSGCAIDCTVWLTHIQHIWMKTKRTSIKLYKYA